MQHLPRNDCIAAVREGNKRNQSISCTQGEPGSVRILEIADSMGCNLNLKLLASTRQVGDLKRKTLACFRGSNGGIKHSKGLHGMCNQRCLAECTLSSLNACSGEPCDRATCTHRNSRSEALAFCSSRPPAVASA